MAHKYYSRNNKNKRFSLDIKVWDVSHLNSPYVATLIATAGRVVVVATIARNSSPQEKHWAEMSYEH